MVGTLRPIGRRHAAAGAAVISAGDLSPTTCRARPGCRRQGNHADARMPLTIAAGVKTAHLFVGNGDMDDATMIRVYAQENATQRGNMGTAQIGSIASTLKFLTRLRLRPTRCKEDGSGRAYDGVC